MNRDFFLEQDEVMALLDEGPREEGILSVYLDPPSERRHEAQLWQTMLNSGLTQLTQQYAGDRRLERIAAAAVKELHALDPDVRHRGLVYFRSLDPDWGWWKSVTGAVGTRFLWGRRPAVFPALVLLHREPAIGVLIASHDGLIAYTWRQSHMQEVERWPLDLDTEHWRRFAAGAYPQPQRQQQTVTHAERFRSRFAELVQRELAKLAPRLEEAAVRQRWEGLMVFGSGSLRDAFVSRLPQHWQKQVVPAPEGPLPTVDVQGLGRTVAEVVPRWRDESDREELRALKDGIGTGGRAVIGGQEAHIPHVPASF